MSHTWRALSTKLNLIRQGRIFCRLGVREGAWNSGSSSHDARRKAVTHLPTDVFGVISRPSSSTCGNLIDLQGWSQCHMFPLFILEGLTWAGKLELVPFGLLGHPNLKQSVPEDTQKSYKGVLFTPKKNSGCPMYL
jgi:hypothetical protein